MTNEKTSESKVDREYLRSALRCFDALELMNTYGVLTTGELARLLSVPRTTAARVLRTLSERGYVARNEAGRFMLTREVHRLASGYHSEDQAGARIREILNTEAQSFLWPLAVVLPRGDAMLTFAPTDALTPYKLVCTPEGSRIPFVGTAAGAAYLAFCSGEERVALLRMAAEDPAATEMTMAQVETDVRVAKAHGYAVKGDWRVGSRRMRHMYKGQKVIALPLISEGRIKGCLTARIITSAVPKAEIASKIYPRLQLIAARLTASWQSESHPPRITLAAE